MRRIFGTARRKNRNSGAIRGAYVILAGSHFGKTVGRDGKIFEKSGNRGDRNQLRRAFEQRKGRDSHAAQPSGLARFSRCGVPRKEVPRQGVFAKRRKRVRFGRMEIRRRQGCVEHDFSHLRHRTRRGAYSQRKAVRGRQRKRGRSGAYPPCAERTVRLREIRIVRKLLQRRRNRGLGRGNGKTPQKASAMYRRRGRQDKRPNSLRNGRLRETLLQSGYLQRAERCWAEA